MDGTVVIWCIGVATAATQLHMPDFPETSLDIVLVGSALSIACDVDLTPHGAVSIGGKSFKNV
jgi:hypothetical protein